MPDFSCTLPLRKSLRRYSVGGCVDSFETRTSVCFGLNDREERESHDAPKSSEESMAPSNVLMILYSEAWSIMAFVAAEKNDRGAVSNLDEEVV